MRPRSPSAALAMLLTFGLAGCGHVSATQSPAREEGLSVTTVSPQADGTARWADGYCGAVSHFVRALATLPTVDPSTPQQASRTSSDLLKSLVGGLDESVASLDALAAPPSPAADKARQDVRRELTQIRAQADDVRNRIEAVRGDPGDTKDALGKASATLDRVANLDVLKGLRADPALEDAERRSPGCQELTQPPR